MQFGNLSAGAHKLEVKNLTGVVYVDRFCLQNSQFECTTNNRSGKYDESIEQCFGRTDFE